MQILLWFSAAALVFVNGWTDAPNAIAGLVATRGMEYRRAAILAAVCNLVGALAFCLVGGQVAKTMMQLADFSQYGSNGLLGLTGCFLAVVIFACIAWLWGIPTSESHGLLAGILGATLALDRAAGFQWADWQPVLIGLFLSLALGFGLGFLLWACTKKAFAKAREKHLVLLQKLGAAASAFLHGGQDGQKFAAVFTSIWLLSFPSLGDTASLQLPAAALCAVIIGLGTLCGGRRIIQKTAMEMVHIDKGQAVASDFSSAAALFILSMFGIPVSTTHTKNAAMAGCAAAASRKSVDTGIMGQMVLAWVATFPLCGALAFLLTRLLLAVF